MNSIGSKLKQIRTNQNITQEQLASGITNRSYISQIEKGIVNPSMKLLRKLCERLNCDIQMLFDYDESNVIKLDIKNKLSDIEYLLTHNEITTNLEEDFRVIEGNLENINKIDLALYYFCRGMYERNYNKNLKNAIEFFIQSIELYSKNNFYNENIRSINELVDIFIELNELDKAFNYIDKSYKELFMQNIGGVERIKFFTNLGISHAKIGEYHSAIRFLQSALDLSNGMKVYVMTGQTLMVLGLCYKRLKQYSLALTYYEKALSYFRGVSDKINLANTLTNIGILYRNTNKFEKSIILLIESKSIFEELYDNFGYLNVIYELAVSQYFNENYSEVISLAEIFNKKSYNKFPSRIGIKFLILQGDAYFSTGEIKKSITFYEKALSDPEITLEYQRDIAFYINQKLDSLNIHDWGLIVKESSKKYQFDY